MKILAADWVLPISAAPIRGGAVAVEKDKIARVGTKEKLREEFPEAALENFGEAAIMPGLINAHSHLELTAMRGFLDYLESDFSAWLVTLAKTRAEKLTAADVKISALCGALEGLRAGVTCFADIGRLGFAGLQALKKTGLRGVVFQETEFSPKNDAAREDFGKLEEKFLALRAGETNLVKIGLSPHAPYTVSRPLFEIIGDYAARENVKLSVHAAESAAEIEFMQKGTGFFARMYQKFGVTWSAPRIGSIEFLAQTGILRAKPLLAHCVKLAEKDLELIGESESGIAHCPKSNAKFGHGVASFEKFLEKKLRVGFGSDSVASNNTCDIFEEARFAALFARAREEKNDLISAEKTLETMTFGAARALGLENEIGTLEPEKQADLIVVSLENIAQQPVHDISSVLVFASNARDVALTMVAGEEIYRAGVALKIDESELRGKIKEIASRMSESF